MHPQRVRNNLKLHGPMLQVINNPKGIRNPKLSLEAGIKATKKKKKGVLINIQCIPFLTSKVALPKNERSLIVYKAILFNVFSFH